MDLIIYEEELKNHEFIIIDFKGKFQHYKIVRFDGKFRLKLEQEDTAPRGAG